MLKQLVMQVITNTSALEEFCSPLHAHEYITIDTEFMRERTYWSRLCLIQVASPDDEAIVDPLADAIDLTALFEVLDNQAVVKVFHAARQDVEIFHKLLDRVPKPLFDTQVAAMACGHGDQIGYEPLVRAITGAAIDKGSRFTDWSRRPLSQKQLEYALGDVVHLRDVYCQLKDELEKTDRFSWVQEEMEALLDPALYFVKPEVAWKRLKLRGLKRKDIGPFIKIAEWREAEAQARDLPRSRVLKDEAIYELARQAPKTADALSKCRGVANGFEKSSQAKSLIAAINAGVALPNDEVPEIERSRNLPPIPGDVLDLLRVLLKRQCEHYQVASKLVANASDLEAIARYDEPDIPAMRGWRRQVFGEAAIKLKKGELALKLNESMIEFVDLKP